MAQETRRSDVNKVCSRSSVTHGAPNDRVSTPSFRCVAHNVWRDGMGVTLEHDDVQPVSAPPSTTPVGNPQSHGETPAPSRRGFFVAAAAALALGATDARAQSRRGARRKAPEPVRGLSLKLSTVAAPPDQLLAIWRDPVARLVRRITLGINKDELARAQKLGYGKYLDEQLRPSLIPDSAVAAFVATNYPSLAMTPDALYAADQGRNSRDIQEATLYRAAFSKRQLNERMVEFWSDHFNVNRNEVGYLKTVDDRDVIRRHALGKFPAMLKASAHSAAMMLYLDQTSNRRGNTNENYAREIMELHTLGADGPYTQQDVSELARVLTGWTNSGRGIFTYDAAIHDFGPKSVMGRVIPATVTARGVAGKSEADAIVDMLAAHPKTANYIALKMTKFLLQYDPTDALVQAVAAEYTKTKGDIPSMIRIILSEQNLSTAPAKYKRPFHFAVSAVRALGPTVTSMSSVRSQVDVMGHSIFAWETPDGYPDKLEFWSGLVLQRWNAATNFVNSTGATFNVDITPFVGTSAESGADLIAERLFGGEVPLSFKTRIADYLRPSPTNTTRVREAVGLAMSSSQFQWY
jgi:uncharacterized protein (DUF1800 family)